MSDAIKVTGICVSGILCFAFVAIGEMELGYSFAGVFGALLGFPVIGKGLQKLIK